MLSGPTGCGKSTLANCVVHIYPRHARGSPQFSEHTHYFGKVHERVGLLDFNE